MAAPEAVTPDQLEKLVLDKSLAAVPGASTPAALVAALKSHADTGMSSADVPGARAAFGENRLPPKVLKSYLEHLKEALSDPVLLALIACAVITICFGIWVSKEAADYIEGAAIMVAVVIVSGVGSVNNWLQEGQFASLSAVKADRSVQVVRDGREQTVSVFDVVVGDLFVIKAGELLPCDGLLLHGSGLKCDESAMTGESLEVPKTVNGEGHNGPYMTAGAQVTAGAGAMVVLTVGERTSFGKIIKNLETAEPPPTPLQEKLENMAKQIGLMGIGGGIGIFLVLLIAYLVHAHGNFGGAFGQILSFFIIGITIIVVAVPEGLPLAVMIALAYSMRQMIKDMVLVRELNACETMGSVTTICSDKTGTLTENRMTVIKLWFGGDLYSEALPGAVEVGGAQRVDEIARAVALNSDAMVTYEQQEHGNASKVVVAGNKSEGALLHMLKVSFSVDYSDVRKSNGRFLFRENFSSARKRMTTVFISSSGDYNVYCKGASEMVLALCANYRTSNGSLVEIDAAKRGELQSAIDSLAAQGLRTFAVAVRTLPQAAAPCKDSTEAEALQEAWNGALDVVESGLTLLLIAGIADPVRAAVPAAVAQCKLAGIKVRMVTGDNLSTAKFIAAQCGILEGGECIEGRAWREMTDAQRAELVPRLDVMARAVPQDKLLLVEALKALGQTVAVTGDGTNDAPALRAAHVGCAMGIAGTEVAKEAGKMIILDDNFASIVTAIVWGRSVLENIRKFLCFQLTINLVAGLMTFIMACFLAGKEPKEGNAGKPEFPLSAVQLLWINLLMDSFAALMLATEPPDPELMRMPPQDKSRPLVTLTMAKGIVVHSVYQLILLLCLSMTTAGTRLFLVPESGLGHREHYTCIFNSFVFLQLFNLFNCRRVHDQHDIFRGFSKSTLGMSVLAIIVVLQIILIEVGGDAFQTMPISGPQWGISLAIGLTSFPVGLIARLIPIRSADDKGRSSSVASCADGPASAVSTPTPTSNSVEMVRVVSVPEGPARASA